MAESFGIGSQNIGTEQSDRIEEEPLVQFAPPQPREEQALAKQRTAPMPAIAPMPTPAPAPTIEFEPPYEGEEERKERFTITPNEDVQVPQKTEYIAPAPV
jgi:hypothetical protein